MRHSTEHVIAHYVPQLPAERWAPIRHAVRDTIRSYAGTRTPEAVRLALNYLTFFLDWVAVTAMVPIADALRGDVIDVYTRHRETEVSPPVAARERKLLRTLAGLTNGPSAGRGTSSPSEVPYSADEQTVLWDWAQHQRGTQQRLNCLAILTLGVGCGLTVTEMLAVRGRDIIATSNGELTVDVLGGARSVPVLNAWSTELAEIKTSSSDSAFVIAPGATNRSRQTTGSVIVASHGELKPSPQRLRATWLISHLNAGTPINVLLDAAGLTAADSLKRSLPHMRVPDVAERESLLRRAGTGGAL